MTTPYQDTANRFLKKVQKRIRALHMNQLEALRGKESLSKGESLLEWQREVILDSETTFSDSIKDLNLLVDNIKESLNINEGTSEEMTTVVELGYEGELGDEDRYLCVYDGYIIRCMDLKNNKSDTKKVPSTISTKKVPSTISTVSLLAEGFPILAGLFKSGSCAYMVGGQEFPSFEKGTTDLELLNSVFWGGAKGASKKTYQLSLVDGSLCLCESDVLNELKEPKFWPVAVKIAEQIHVIDTIPYLGNSNLCRPTGPSHEFLGPNQSQWNELSSGKFIESSLVVGHLIYAHDRFSETESYLVFDSITGKWETLAYCCQHGESLFTIKHVAGVLNIGCGSCVPGLLRSKSFHVVIAIGSDSEMKMRAAAYLVTSTGRILCYQRLERVFAGFRKTFNTTRCHGTLITVDEYSSMMCSILQKMDTNVLYITTFYLEAMCDLEHLGVYLMEQMEVESDADTLPCPKKIDFVYVCINDWYVSPWIAQLSDICTRLTACFL